MQACQKGLDFLLGKYADGKKATLQENNTVTFHEKTIPLLPWRAERRFLELHNLVSGGRIEDVSVLRVSHIAKKGTDLDALLRREVDICRYLLDADAKIEHTVASANTKNVVLTLSNGVVCTLELAATLPEGATPIDKHEIIARRGVACDRVVDTQVPAQSLYLFSEEEIAAYTDTDYELYGLCDADVALVRQAFRAVTDPDFANALCALAQSLEEVLA